MSLVKVVVYSSLLYNFFFICSKNNQKRYNNSNNNDNNKQNNNNNNCPFCDYPKEKIIFQNDNVVVFSDRTPKASTHYLVCPKNHIESIKTLQPSDLPVLIEMKDVANQIVKERFPNEKYRLGFHVPPFYSVKHLHLHLLVEPFFRFKEMKYTPHFNGIWYRDVDTVINDLYEQAA